MRAIIVGCGRVGAGIAERLARAGHEVTVIDISTEAFSRLESDFPGSAIRGDGTDEDVLRRAGAEGADLFFALTEGDNRNILAAQLAAETLGHRRTSWPRSTTPSAPRPTARSAWPRSAGRGCSSTPWPYMPGCRRSRARAASARPTGQHPGGDHPPRAASPAAGTEA